MIVCDSLIDGCFILLPYSNYRHPFNPGDNSSVYSMHSQQFLLRKTVDIYMRSLTVDAHIVFR